MQGRIYRFEIDRNGLRRGEYIKTKVHYGKPQKGRVLDYSPRIDSEWTAICSSTDSACVPCVDGKIKDNEGI